MWKPEESWPTCCHSVFWSWMASCSTDRWSSESKPGASHTILHMDFRNTRKRKHAWMFKQKALFLVIHEPCPIFQIGILDGSLVDGCVIRVRWRMGRITHWMMWFKEPTTFCIRKIITGRIYYLFVETRVFTGIQERLSPKCLVWKI